MRKLMCAASIPVRRSCGVFAMVAASGFLLIILLSGCAGAGPVSAAQSVEQGDSALPYQGRIQDFELADQHGNRVALSDFRGQVVLLSFFYSECPDFCPSMNHDLKRINEALTGHDREELVLLSVSFDPVADSPSTLRQYTERNRFDATNWHFLSGSALEIGRVLAASGIVAEETPPEEHAHNDGSTHHHPRGFNHMAQALLIDQRGEVRKAYLGAAQGGEVFSVELLTGDIQALIGEGE